MILEHGISEDERFSTTKVEVEKASTYSRSKDESKQVEEVSLEGLSNTSTQVKTKEHIE